MQTRTRRDQTQFPKSFSLVAPPGEPGRLPSPDASPGLSPARPQAKPQQLRRAPAELASSTTVAASAARGPRAVLGAG